MKIFAVFIRYLLIHHLRVAFFCAAELVSSPVLSLLLPGRYRWKQ
jgi:hypothetical protein